MKAMVLQAPNQALEFVDIPIPVPNDNQLQIKITVCALCGTDGFILEGKLNLLKPPLILGHQIVGVITMVGKNTQGYSIGQRVGVPWLGYTCGICDFCDNNQENLCDKAGFTGYTLNGGFAEYCVADSRYCFALPDNYSDLWVAPLLCGGVIGYRAYTKTQRVNHNQKIGLYGFGSAAHILIQALVYLKKEVYVFTRPDDMQAQIFAKQLGAHWVGSSTEAAPDILDSAIIFAPVGALVPLALKSIKKGGVVVCAGIHMSQIPAFSYDDLWGEREIVSVANLTRQDAIEFLALAPKVPIQTEVHEYPLIQLNEAISDFREGRHTGTVVIRCLD